MTKPSKLTMALRRAFLRVMHESGGPNIRMEALVQAALKAVGRMPRKSK